jgi:hypothetical protein
MRVRGPAGDLIALLTENVRPPLFPELPVERRHDSASKLWPSWVITT